MNSTPAALRAEMVRRIAERESLVVNELVAKHLSHKLTGEDARAGIAEIAGLRKVVRDLDREMRIAQPA